MCKIGNVFKTEQNKVNLENNEPQFSVGKGPKNIYLNFGGL